MANKYGNYGHPSYNEEKGKMSHASDHKCRPVLVDAEGRKRSIIVLPGETYVTRMETCIEEVYSGSDDEYQHTYTTKCEPAVKYHGRLHEKGNRHSSPTRDRRAEELSNFIAKIQTEASHPNMRHNPHFRVQDENGHDSDRHNDYKKKTTHKPSESYNNWHDKRHGNGNSDNDGDDTDEDSHLMTKPRLAPHAYYDNICKPKHGVVDMMEPKAKSIGNWSRPSHAVGARDARLSAPINNVEKAIEFFKDAVNLQSGKTNYRETIDSKEAASRHGNIRPTHTMKETSYKPIINCKEAAKKYNGTTV